MYIWSGNYQQIKYSVIKLLRLGKDYDTDCRLYGHNYKYETRSDCLTSCVQKHHNIVCNSTKLAFMNTLVREEFISENRNKSFTNCSAYTQTIEDAMISCSKYCNLNCQYKHFPAVIEKLSEVNNSQIDLYVKNNEITDVLIKYIPETSLISFVCNFGGLLGMWLGLSIMAIFNDILIQIFKLTLIKVKAYNQTHNVNTIIINVIPIVNIHNN